MKEVKLNKHIIVSKKINIVLCFNMKADELYSLEGDVGMMLMFINNTPQERFITIDEIHDYLIKNSTTFLKNPEKMTTIHSALSELKRLEIIVDADA